MKYNLFLDWPKKGVTFVDFTPTIMDGKEFRKTVTLLGDKVPVDTDYIVSPEARGFIWGAAVAHYTGKGFIPLRKKNKLPEDAVMASYDFNTEYSIDTLEISKSDIKNKNVFFIDDVLATGGTYKAARVLIDTLHANLTGGAVIYNVGLHDIMKVKQLYFKDLPPIK
jgi:adenine phosphoribosyltransferase